MLVADLSTNDALVICAAFGALPGTAAALLGYLNHRQIRTPSGETIGRIAERVHHLTETNSVQLTKMLNGENETQAP